MKLPNRANNARHPWQSQAVYDLNQQGVRIYNRLREISWLAAAMYHYWRGRGDEHGN